MRSLTVCFLATVPLLVQAQTSTVSVSSSNLTFVQSQWLATQTVTVTNTSGLALQFYNFAYESTSGSAAFSVTDGCAVAYPVPYEPPSRAPVLEPGGTCTLQVSLVPQRESGPVSSSYTIQPVAAYFYFDYPVLAQTITFQALAGGDKNALTFGEAPLALKSVTSEASLPVPLTITGTGAGFGALEISLGGPQASDFRQFNNCPSYLPAGQSCIVWVSYAPVAKSPANSTAVLVANSLAAGFPQMQQLSGSVVQSSLARIVIETPKSGAAAVSGTITVAGWAGQDGVGLVEVPITVDGITVGNAATNLPRADVCAVYPYMINCPDPGWSYQLDTTLIADGPHTLTAFAGLEGSASIQVTVKNGAAIVAPIVVIDAPTPSQQLSGLLVISGWAFAPSAETTNTSVAIDGVNISSVYATPRNDVCTAFNKPVTDCSYAGWYATVNVDNLSIGQHTITVTATATLSTFVSSTAVKTVSFSNKLNSNPILINIDQPQNGQPVASNFDVSGWAATTGAAIYSVTATIDGMASVNMLYGQARPDVCIVLPGRTGCPNVGWSGTAYTSGVTNGLHTLSLTAYATDGTIAIATRQINVVNIISSSADQLLLAVEAPLANGIVSGTALVSGWVVDGVTASPEVDITVDGTPIANGFPTLSRADVCTAYPWAQDCPQVGWQFFIDTTQFADGSHAFGVTATASTGKRVIKIVPFVSNNGPAWLNNGQIVFIESPSASQKVSGSLGVAGWAVSAASPVTELDIWIDGVPMGATTYGLVRQDVCKAYPKSMNCPNVGWYYSLDTLTLTDGPHTLEAVEITANGDAASSQKFTVSNLGASTGIHAVIDAPATDATLSGSYQVSGWAFDYQDTIASVAISLDNLPLGFASYGGARTDVCNAFPGGRGCPNVGWGLDIDTTQFQNGSHTLAVVVTSTLGDVLTLTRSIQTTN